MALIENSKGRLLGSGYARLFGNAEFGYLLSRVQATVITGRNELEKLIVSLANTVNDVDEFLNSYINGTFLISKTAIKKSSLRSNLEPDLLVFKIDNRKSHCYIIELKDGDNFDTKKQQEKGICF